jgi:hypothetical protein
MKILLLSAALLFSTLFLFSCKKDNPIPPEDLPQVNLSLEDVSCTEAWLKLTTANINLSAEVSLKQDDRIIQNIILSIDDTLLYVDSLLPNHSYKFQSVIQSVNQESDAVNLTTIDTTSHSFTFETFTFGGTAGSSTLYDVAIIDENDIWAVGEIYLADTSQNGYTLYNAVHWNGNQWELKRISVIHNGSSITPPLYGIFAFSETDIWLSAGVPIHGDGVNWIQYHLFDMGILTQEDGYLTKIWGESSTNIYFVGTLGTIAHYQNGQWSRIESGTTSIINDVWGVIDNENRLILYCPVSSFFVPGDKKILKIIDNKVDSVEWNRDVRLYSAWTSDNNFLYVCGEGVYTNKSGIWNQINIPSVGTNSIRGKNLNDIFIVGDYGFKAHFNGVTWIFFDLNRYIGFSKVAFKENRVVMCGNYNGQGLIQVGIRN